MFWRPEGPEAASGVSGLSSYFCLNLSLSESGQKTRKKSVISALTHTHTHITSHITPTLRSSQSKSSEMKVVVVQIV